MVMPSVPKSGPLADPFGLVGETLAGKFAIESVVAAGGFGVLYRGTHLTLSRPIAIKVLRAPDGQTPAMRDAIRVAFEQEARVIARLNHPAIVHAIEFGVEPRDEQPLLWMVLEWLDGRPLNVVLRERRGVPYSPAETFALMRPILEALAYAHEQGVAHRDLKPANIMVLPGRRGPALKLIDFGIAKSMEDGEAAGSGETKTRSAVSAYSPRYASPEQIGQGRTGPWTDVHAAALILTEMLVGHAAYESHGGDPTSLVAAALNPERPTPGSFGVNVGAWEPVFRKALSIRAADRHPNAGALLDALEQSSSEPLKIEAHRGSGSPSRSDDASGISQPSISGIAPISAPMTGGLPALREIPKSSRRGLILAAVVVAVVLCAAVLALARHGRGSNPPANIAVANPAPPPLVPHAVAPLPVVPTAASVPPPTSAIANPPSSTAATPPAGTVPTEPREAPAHTAPTHGSHHGDTHGAPRPGGHRGPAVPNGGEPVID